MGQLRNDIDDLYQNGQVGDWCFKESPQGLLMFLRYPISDEVWKQCYPECEGQERGDLAVISLSGDHAWQWDGNREAPTVSPSILVKGHGGEARWHGFMRAGNLETV